MPPIVTTAEIGRPAAELFACSTDPARFKERTGSAQGHVPAAGWHHPGAVTVPASGFFTRMRRRLSCGR